MNWRTLLLGSSLLVGCGALDVSDPTRIEDEDLGNATSAELMRKEALGRLAVAVGRGAVSSGMLADEFLADPPSHFVDAGLLSPEEALDRRRGLEYERQANAGTVFSDPYAGWHEVRRAAMAAIPRLRTYAPEPPRSAHIGQMLAVKGFAALRLAEDFCPGFPLNTMVDYKLILGPPLTTDEALEQALADFDSALVYAADSAPIADLARVGRARALLGLGRFDEAAGAVALVATDYVWNAEFSSTFDPGPNPLFFRFSDGSVADREGAVGLDFVSAADPRLRVDTLGMASDGVTHIYRASKYADMGASIVLTSGLEARLIEAEAALNAGGDWLGILNQLRATQVSPALPPLADPGTVDARVDLLFRERAFWLFGTGHRLADLRRLIARYGRAAEGLFPTGAYWRGGTYETATSIPFPGLVEGAYNPAVTGCTSR